MSILVDTNVAIHLRDLERSVLRRLHETGELIAMSIVTVIELEGGICHLPSQAAARRVGLQRLLTTTEVIGCDRAIASVYGTIVERLGFSRPKLLDRLIAATAIVHGLTLVTMNGPDFQDIPGLALKIWPAPGQ